MAIRISIIVFLTLLDYMVYSTKVFPSKEMMCPNVCHCYYLGINWQTDCSESNLTNVTLDGLDSNVYTLIMNKNHLKKIDQFQPNIKVKSLQLSHNALTTIQKEAFAGLQYLLDVDLSSNLINYVHPEAFIENVGFTALQLQNNPLLQVEGPFLYSKTLRFLYLQNCQLTALSRRFFTEINGLIKVDLSGNPLRTIEAGAFDPLTTLKHLILNNVNLTQISSIENHTNVVVLPNDNLNIHGFWSLIVGKFLGLEHLELKQSGISNLPENVLSDHVYLRHLVLAENQLSNDDLNTTLGQNIANIRYLDLSYCHLKAPLSKYAFAKAKKLRSLVLSGNNLTSPSATGLSEALTPLSKLVKLSLSNCGFTEIPKILFPYLVSIKKLDISMNPLNDCLSESIFRYYSNKMGLESLDYLNLSYTNMTSINTFTLSRMTSLKTLVLSGNKIKSWASGFLNKFPSLALLELNDCGLIYLDSTVFHGIASHPALEELRLSGNPLLQIRGTLDYFQTVLPALKSLDLSHCDLIDFSLFQKYAPSLSRLLLNNNKFAGTIDMRILNYPRVLEHLDVSYNYLTSIKFGKSPYSYFMPDSSNLTSLTLIGNPWPCDCSIWSLWKWAKQGLVGLKYSIASNEDANNLVCNFDRCITLSPTKGLTQNKPCVAVTSKPLQYTWARYVSEFESICNCFLYYAPEEPCHNEEVKQLQQIISKKND